MGEISEAGFLNELVPEAESLFQRHEEKSTQWYPHEFVPWSLGRDFEPGEVWDPNEFPLPSAVRSALFVNLLTEDNLPNYYRVLNEAFGIDTVWREWNNRWTQEEAKHSTVIRDYIHVTRAFDPRKLEDGRKVQMDKGEVPSFSSPEDGFVYAALQELATRIAHRNTGKVILDQAKIYPENPAYKAGYDVMGRVATDENHHFLFYRELTSKALEIDASKVVLAIERQVRQFEMPGTGIPEFKKHAQAISDAEIYNLEQHHDQILVPVVLNTWKVEKLERLTPKAEEARESLLKRITRIGSAARIITERAQVRLANSNG